LGAWVVAAVLALAAWMTRPPERAGPELAGGGGEVFGLGLEPAGIEEIEVVSAGVGATLRRDGDWTLVLPDASGGSHRWPADPGAARGLVRDLAALTVEAGEIGPGEVRAEVRVRGGAGEPVTVRALGGALGGRVPVVVEAGGRSRGGLVEAARFRPASVEDLAGLAAARPLAPDGVVVGVEIVSEGAGVRLVRRAGIWGLEDSPARLDQAAARSLVEGLASVRAAGVVVPFDDAGIGRGVVRIALRVQRARSPGEPAVERRLGLVIGPQSTIEGAVSALATRGEDERLLITLDPSALPPLPAGPEPLLDRRPLPWDAAETGSIEVARDGATRRFTRRLEGWVAEDGPAESAVVRGLLDALAAPHPARLLGDETPGGTRLTLAPVGSGSPVTLRVTSSGASVTVDDGAAAWTVDGAALAEAIGSLLGG